MPTMMVVSRMVAPVSGCSTDTTGSATGLAYCSFFVKRGIRMAQRIPMTASAAMIFFHIQKPSGSEIRRFKPRPAEKCTYLTLY